MPAEANSPKLSLFTRFAWGYYAYLLFVIVFGAWVRISGSGAGCGSSWPTCQGEIIPPSASVKTWIEYSHRLTSGMLGLLSLALLVWVFRARVDRRCRITASVTLLFVFVEAAVGAGIVLRELVADNASVARAIVISLHLVSTLVLAACAGLTAYWSTERPQSVAPIGANWRWGLLALLLGAVLASMTGAVTALGDTLFPVPPTEGAGIFSHVRDDLAPASHFLVRLRIVHPLIAAALIGALITVLNVFSLTAIDAPIARILKWARALMWCQLAVGVCNILLRAPAWLQLGHLALAHGLWLSLVLLTARLWETPKIS
ncbi:MAG TPA: COX15/CtaA family protein [Polyangiaceae bacterium]|nr:COX15/CtaA family protein [Polyangiaceae bacterium]